ncbi:MAG: hydroxyacylglutathione hydrolase, partial [Burkholderiales bacterium]|nr:hydroxyacylglutathione hydrolase [Burkholderiales bacterium]
MVNVKGGNETVVKETVKKIRVAPVAAFRDNYIWVLHDGRHAAVIDPGDAAPVEIFLAEKKLELNAILATHHHADHVGGVADLIAARRIPVYGPRNESIPTVTQPLGEGDQIGIDALGLHFTVFDIPGHTAGHIAYYGAGMVFCGDTLFGGGCGRLFEGTAAQMVSSLGKLAALPDETLIYCGHEYTVANLRFARTVEPDSVALQQRERIEAEKRERGEPTLPSSIGLERQTNPFVRYRE